MGCNIQGSWMRKLGKTYPKVLLPQCPSFGWVDCGQAFWGSAALNSWKWCSGLLLMCLVGMCHKKVRCSQVALQWRERITRFFPMNILPGSIRHDRLKHGCNWLRQHVPLGWNCEASHLGVIFWGQIFYATGSFGIEPIIMPFSPYVLERLTLGVSQVTPCRSHRLDSLLTAPIEYIAPGQVIDGFLKALRLTISMYKTCQLTYSFEKLLEVGGVGLCAQQPPLVAAHGWNAQVESWKTLASSLTCLLPSRPSLALKGYWSQI